MEAGEVTEAPPFEQTKTRLAMLKEIVNGRIYAWAGHPIRKYAPPADELFEVPLLLAYFELVAAGYVVGENVTQHGFALAEEWGLRPQEHVRIIRYDPEEK
jgi:hypothetical protein